MCRNPAGSGSTSFCDARRGESATRGISHLFDGTGTQTYAISTIGTGSELILPSEVDGADGPVIVIQLPAILLWTKTTSGICVLFSDYFDSLNALQTHAINTPAKKGACSAQKLNARVLACM